MSLVVWIIGAICLCLLAEGFFSASEIALISMDKVRLRTLVSKGSESAKLAAELLRKPELLLGTTLMGTNSMTVLASTLATYLVHVLWGDAYELLAIFIMSPLVLIFAETIPKTLAVMRPEQIALFAARPLTWIRNILRPGFSSLSRITSYVTGLKPLSRIARSPLMSREDLEYALRTTGQRGGVKAIARQMITRIFHFRNTKVEDVMIPLVEVVALEAHTLLQKATEVITRHGLSRVPIYRERVDNIVGILIAVDLLFLEIQNNVSLVDMMRPPLFVPPSKPVKDMLADFRRSNVNMAVVVDEYGGAVGIVTPEDILEEVVGEIEDEFDPRKKLVSKIHDNLFTVDARIRIVKLRELLRIELPEGNYDTLAGFLLDYTKHIPRQGETIQFRNYTFRITRGTNRAIDEVQITVQ